jgi:tetratricopeptide (TPR) repeat protein
MDRAIIEYTAAIYHYEQAQHERYGAANENNLIFLLYKLGRYEQAHEHLDRARRVMVRFKDAGLLAQVDETRARVFVAEQKYREANGVLDGVIQTLEKGGELPSQPQIRCDNQASLLTSPQVLLTLLANL